MCQSPRVPSMKVPDFSTNRDFRTGDRIASLHGKRTTTLVNLGPPTLFQGAEGDRLNRFIAALGTDERAHFKKVTWSDVLAEGLADAPKWVTDFCKERGLTS
jgi:hypothetical protein